MDKKDQIEILSTEILDNKLADSRKEADKMAKDMLGDVWEEMAM